MPTRTVLRWLALPLLAIWTGSCSVGDGPSGAAPDRVVEAQPQHRVRKYSYKRFAVRWTINLPDGQEPFASGQMILHESPELPYMVATSNLTMAPTLKDTLAKLPHEGFPESIPWRGATSAKRIIEGTSLLREQDDSIDDPTDLALVYQPWIDDNDVVVVLRVVEGEYHGTWEYRSFYGPEVGGEISFEPLLPQLCGGD